MTAIKQSWPPQGHHENLSRMLVGARRSRQAEMPQASERLLQALDQLRRLQSRFIRLNPTGTYSESQYLASDAFVVLAHAAIETYVERAAIEAIDGCVDGYLNDRRPRTVVLALLAHCGEPNREASAAGSHWQVMEAIKEARTRFHQMVKDNNGIKGANIARLFLPTGIKEADMPESWVETLDAFGDMRGRVAHNSALHRAQTPVDPGDAVKTVEQVMTVACRIDFKLNILCAE